MKNVMKDVSEQSKWQDMTAGGYIYGSGNAVNFCTGDWRTTDPVWVADKCRQCLLCVPVCPDSSIAVSQNKRGDFDFDHCKGCGICYKVCPFAAIEFSKNTEK